MGEAAARTLQTGANSAPVLKSHLQCFGGVSERQTVTGGTENSRGRRREQPRWQTHSRKVLLVSPTRLCGQVPEMGSPVQPLSLQLGNWAKQGEGASRQGQVRIRRV